MLSVLLLLALAPLRLEVRGVQGLWLDAANMPLVRGSWWQVYEPGWTRGYFSSNSGGVVGRKDMPGGEIELDFADDANLVRGSQRWTPTADGVRIQHKTTWSGEKPAGIEICFGMIWAEPWKKAVVDGVEKSAEAHPFAPNESRHLALAAKRIELVGPAGRLELSCSAPKLSLIDVRNGYPQSWAQDEELFWFGLDEGTLEPGVPFALDLDVKFVPSPATNPARAETRLASATLPGALCAGEALPLVPKPKQNELRAETVRLGSKPTFHAPSELRPTLEACQRFLDARWKRVPGSNGRVDCRVADLGLPPEGFELNLEPSKIQVRGQSLEGLRNGLWALVWLARPSGGALALPRGKLRDWPTLDWRGVHRFVGPGTGKLHRKLWERVLLPMHLNRAVLQVERTDWKSTPGIQTALTMPLPELEADFAMLRSHGVEPIPLIQSFGHVEWLFANGRNLDLAINPDKPYAIDPSKPAARQLIGAIWNEAQSALHPKIWHLGLDEVDMIGMANQHERVTELWESYLPWLGAQAKSRGAELMLWGDMALAQGEAPDATNAPDLEQARRRRAAIPKGSWIADWHYAAQPDPEPFRKSLALWKSLGMKPVASTWYSPDNIRGFAGAAKREGAGLLQTTWSGYTSSEKAMRDDLRGFAAYILAGDYAWSGRSDLPADLGYDWQRLFERLYWGPPEPVRAEDGIGFGTGPLETFDGVAFRRLGEPLGVFGRLEADTRERPDRVSIRLDAPKGELALLLQTDVRGLAGSPVGAIEVELDDGSSHVFELRYGQEAKLQPSVWRHRFDQAVRGVTLRSDGSPVGLRLLGATVVP